MQFVWLYSIPDVRSTASKLSVNSCDSMYTLMTNTAIRCCAWKDAQKTESHCYVICEKEKKERESKNTKRKENIRKKSKVNIFD